MESFACGTSKVDESSQGNFSLITLAPELFSSSGFNPTRHAAPYTAISRYAKGSLFVIATPLQNGWSYRIDYPYYSWAETVVRPRVPRRDFSGMVSRLNQLEQNRSGQWKLDHSEMTSAVKFRNAEGTLAPSSLWPAEIANVVRVAILADRAAVATS